jgi:hypothetical protein
MFRFTWSVVLFFGAALLAGCAPETGATTASAGPDTPGWTGRTMVVGSSSTIAGAAEATYIAQKWGVGRER